MAELVKKLKLQNTKGTVESCTLFSTKEEANAMGGVLPLHVDGVDCFAALGAITESEATSGRQEKNGVSLAILKQGGITPGSITVKGTGTFTVPKSVIALKLTYLNLEYQEITSYVKVEAGETYGYGAYVLIGGKLDSGIMVKTVFGKFTFQEGQLTGAPKKSVPLPITIAWSTSINKEATNGTA